jgi:hypothetical protein
MMVGITGNNQQMPIPHNLEIRLPRSPALAPTPTETAEGAIGVAVNGVPIFSPDTQGPVQPETGRPVSAAEAGELDTCGGHAGRGDDYHYHRAPNCLIEDLGADWVEGGKPIGYAADGFPILAFGWFDPAHDIESLLDRCRGIEDANGRYFYNVEHSGAYAVIDCYSGTVQHFARDHWDQRIDAAGQEMIGIPVHFAVTGFKRAEIGGQTCYRQMGTLSGEQLMTTAGQVVRPGDVPGELFHCSPSCYGTWVEVKAAAPGRTIAFEMHDEACPAGLPASATSANGFAAYRIAD